MAENDNPEIILQQHNVKPTAVRLLVLRELEKIKYAFSLADVCDRLPTVDRSTIFRTLTVFADAHMLHTIVNGNGEHEYCLCHNSHTCRPDELHCHFHCTRCGHTFCLTNVTIPSVALPLGYAVENAEYVMQGLCPRCRGIRE